MKTKNKCLQLVSLTLALLVPTITAQANPNWVDIWRDDFNRPSAGADVGNGWVEFDTSGDVSIAALSGGEMVLQIYGDGGPGWYDGPSAYILVPTTGYQYVDIFWKVKGSPYTYPTFDVLDIDVTTDGGTTWTRVAFGSLTTEWSERSSTPGASVDNQPGFGIRLRTRLYTSDETNLSSRGALFDYIGLRGVPMFTSDQTPPAVSGVTANDVEFPADVTVTATATDAVSNIKSAEYSLDGGPWTLMSATDGAFDEKSEGLSATISGMFVKTYEVCVRATDVEDNPSDGTACDTFKVTAASLNIAFAGQLLDVDGSPTELRAEVTGPCSSLADVEFFADPGSGYVSRGTATTDTSGVATKTVSLQSGVYDIRVEVEGQDLGGDGAVECLGDTDTGITVVADAKASSTGGGWYKIDGLSPPRVNFGYTAQRKYNKKLDEYSTSGNLLWMHQDSYRLKGVIDSGAMLPECDPEFAACAAFAGEGTLYEHNPAYDPACLPTDYCGLEWVNPSPKTPFVIFVNDGGTSRECVSKKKCKDVDKPDQFGIEIALESIPAESKPVYLNGGNLVVR